MSLKGKMMVSWDVTRLFSPSVHL